MTFKSESIPSRLIHQLTELKLKDDDTLKVWFEAINWSFISTLCNCLYSDLGAPAYNPISMFKALLLIYLGQALSERDLAEKLRFDVRLQALCGFDFFHTPKHASFHYFRKRLGKQLFYHIVHKLIAQAYVVGIIKDLIHTAIDSTHIWANANKYGIKICQCKGKCDCQRNYSDSDARWGHKSKEYAFFGYKVHLIVQTKSQLPIEVIVTSGEVADNTKAGDLIDQALENHQPITILSSSMDAAYDDTDIYKHCVKNKIHPIIALNPRNSQGSNLLPKPDVQIDTEGNYFCCKTKLPLVKNGSEPKRKNRLKLICYPTKERLSFQTIMLSQIKSGENILPLSIIRH